MANVLRAVGRIDEATKLTSDVMTRYPTVYSEEHPFNHGCIGNLALLRRLLGDTKGARELNEKALMGLVFRLWLRPSLLSHHRDQSRYRPVHPGRTGGHT